MVQQFDPIDDETPIDPSLLRDKSITTRSELDDAEAENIRKAFLKYLGRKVTKSRAPFDISWMCKLHDEMFDDVWLYAGKTRQSNLNIGVSWHQVLPQLLDLQYDLEYWHEKQPISLTEQAARLHHRGVSIHPFLGGNGRWSRLLANIWMQLNGGPLVRWPDDIVDTTSPIRAEYIKRIKLADDHDFAPLIELHETYSEQSD